MSLNSVFPLQPSFGALELSKVVRTPLSLLSLSSFSSGRVRGFDSDYETRTNSPSVEFGFFHMSLSLSSSPRDPEYEGVSFSGLVPTPHS